VTSAVETSSRRLSSPRLRSMIASASVMMSRSRVSIAYTNYIQAVSIPSPKYEQKIKGGV
jgi:hypothetical protein